MRPIIQLTAFALLIAAGQGVAQTASKPGSAAAKGGVSPLAEPGPATAKANPVRNPAFYSAEVTVTSQNAAERRGATLRALNQVVVRLTGNPQAPSNNVIRRAAANLDNLVSQSAFRQESETVNGVPVYRTILAVSFAPDGVDALIAGAGLKYWSSERAKPILWLVIDDGRGPRLVTGQQTAVVKPLAVRGLERGLRFLLPAGTAVEQAAVASISNLNAPALQVLTSRYRNDVQLLGKVRRQPTGWSADWLLTQAGVELARWSFADPDPRRVIASGVDDGADAIARRDAVYLDTGVAGLYAIDVDGVDTQADFVRLMAYLQTLPVMRSVSAVEARPGHLRLQLDISVGMKGLRGMFGTGDTLNPISDSAPGSGDVPRFSLQ